MMSQEINGQLSVILANTYVLYLKTQNFHWNVTGEHFLTLHALFEDQYGDLAKQVDDIAERIRTLGYPAPASFQHYLTLTTLQESSGELSWQAMIQCLLADHREQDQLLQQASSMMSDQGDEVSADLAIGLQAMHQKMIWVLKSHLD